MSSLFNVSCIAIVAASFAISAQAQSVEIYGGATLGGQDLNYGPVPPSNPNLQQMDAGYLFGAGVYWGIPGGFEAGLDAMYTNQGYSSWGPGSTLESLSVMANGRYVFAIPNVNITGYVGAGVGSIQLTYDDPAAFLDGDDSVMGWQVEGGLRYTLGAYETFTAIKYQEGFDEALIQSESVEYNSLSLLGGIRF
ncbi:outer membrane beta-barrel protein [Yoonia sp. I 8.24]|uniref:outer membrane beta-barrel protein n=1 Tax=Yoonia sp. I 8.24 TaxID=1537229 RepID=UPI001EE015D3|nr:outer membrane beta-barrel protein [Yoonia sp. I 8.24]MCG3267634.1 porin family protein [Yoonia sp. I 8.24]